MPLLDKFADSKRFFRPATVQEFLALQIARRLGDLNAFRWYVHALSGMAQADVLLALRRSTRSESGPADLAEQFRKELKKISANFQSHA